MEKLWQKTEVETLVNYWYDTPQQEILRLIPDRTWKSIQRKSERLQLKRLRLGPITGKPTIPYDGNIPDWLIGELLSDGHIDPGGKYSHTSQYPEYILFLQEKFDSINVPVTHSPNIVFDKRTNHVYSRWLLRTASTFKLLRKKWYSNGKKIVPFDISINDEMLSHWIMSDGSTNFNNFLLCTEGFCKKDQIFLQRKLKEYGIICTVQKNGNLYIKKVASNESRIKIYLSEIKGNSIPNCYIYKFNNLKKWGRK